MRKLPDPTIAEISTERQIRRLLESILIYDEDPSEEKFEKIDGHRLLIAYTVVEIAIRFCIKQYEWLFSDTPSLTRSTISDLKNTIENCKDISYKANILNIEDKQEQRKYEYIFDWNNFPGRATKRVIKFLWKETGTPISDVSKFESYPDKSIISFSVTADLDLEWKVQIDIELNKGEAFLHIFDEHGDPIRGISLMAKLKNNIIHFYRAVK